MVFHMVEPFEENWKYNPRNEVFQYGICEIRVVSLYWQCVFAGFVYAISSLDQTMNFCIVDVETEFIRSVSKQKYERIVFECYFW